MPQRKLKNYTSELRVRQIRDEHSRSFDQYINDDQVATCDDQDDLLDLSQLSQRLERLMRAL